MEFKFGSYGHIAQRNLNSAVRALEVGDWADAVFNAQQAVEKILKEYINCSPFDGSKELLHSHKPIRIYRMSPLPPILSSYEQILSDLGDSYFDTRYPGPDFFEPTESSAVYLVTGAQDTFQIITDVIQSEKRSKANSSGSSVNKLHLD